MVARIRVLARRAPLESSEIALDSAVSHHVARVLRAREGDAVVVFDGEGLERDARVASVRDERRSVIVRVAFEGSARSGVVADRAAVHVLQGLAKGDKLERVVRACAELGAAAVWPVECERSVSRLDASRAEAQRLHLESVSASASEQCGRADLLRVEPVRSVAAALERASGTIVHRCVADEAGGVSVAAWLGARAEGPVALLVGPEGGLTDEERALARNAGFATVSLGPRILRTEHAAAAFCAMASAAFGDLRPR